MRLAVFEAWNSEAARNGLHGYAHRVEHRSDVPFPLRNRSLQWRCDAGAQHKSGLAGSFYSAILTPRQETIFRHPLKIRSVV